MTSTNAPATKLADAPPLRLLDQIRARSRYRHFSVRTEVSYVGEIKRFILFHDQRHLREMGAGCKAERVVHRWCQFGYPIFGTCFDVLQWRHDPRNLAAELAAPHNVR